MRLHHEIEGEECQQCTTEAFVLIRVRDRTYAESKVWQMCALDTRKTRISYSQSQRLQESVCIKPFDASYGIKLRSTWELLYCLAVPRPFRYTLMSRSEPSARSGSPGCTDQGMGVKQRNKEQQRTQSELCECFGLGDRLDQSTSR